MTVTGNSETDPTVVRSGASSATCQSRLVSNTSGRTGFTLTEVIVASTLLAAAMAMVGPLAFHQHRLHQQTRLQQLAIDELSNHLEILTTLEMKELETTVEDLQVSEAVAGLFPEAQIDGEVTSHDDGMTSIRLSLQWNDSNRNAVTRQRPISLVAWRLNDSDGSEAQPSTSEEKAASSVNAAEAVEQDNPATSAEESS